MSRYGIFIVAALLAAAPCGAQQPPDDDGTGGEVREFNLWLDDETDQTENENDESNGRPLLKVDIDGLPRSRTGENNVSDKKATTPEPRVDKIGESTVPGTEAELVEQLRREVRALHRELSLLRARVDKLTASTGRSRQPVERPVEQPKQTQDGKGPFYPFWLPQH
jgi:hypothetical protein